MVGERDAKRRQRVRLLQRWVINPPLRLAVRLGLYPGHVLLETTGRRTGQVRRTVVGAHHEASTLWIVAEQGPHAGYVANLRAQPGVRVLLERRWRRATATLAPEIDAHELLDSWGDTSHSRAVHRFGTALRTVRVDLTDV